MVVVPAAATDADIIVAVDGWVSLLEAGNYVAAARGSIRPQVEFGPLN